MMPYLFMQFFLTVVVVAVFLNQIVLRRENDRSRGRIDTLIAGVKTARRGQVAGRRHVAGTQRPTKRNREVMAIGRQLATEVPDINPDEIDQQQS